MPVLRESTLEKYNDLDKIMFPVELKKANEIFPDFEFNANVSNMVIANNKIIAAHPNSYRFESNSEFIQPVIDRMKEIFGADNLEYKVQCFEDRQFFLDVQVNKEMFEITKGDSVCPMVSFTNSYDGVLKQSISLSYYRQICSNGMMGFSKEYSLAARHLVGSKGIAMDRLFKDLENGAKQIQKFKEMTERRVLPGELEEMIEYVKAAKYIKFPKKTLDSVHEIAMNEARALGTDLNKWLAYNAFNNVLNHADTRLFPNQKQSIDKKVLDYVESF